jgi:hypothetical protein
LAQFPLPSKTYSNLRKELMILTSGKLIKLLM